MSNTSRRDRISNLLVRLTETIDADAAESVACLRHLAIAAMNLAEETDDKAVVAAGCALPWIGVLLQWENGQASLDELVDAIDDHDLAHQLGSDSIQRRLARAAGADSAIRRVPDGTGAPTTDIQASILTELFDQDRRLHQLADTAPGECRDALLSDAGLLATALEVRAEGSTSTEVFVQILPDWPVEAPSKSLEVLARFENSDFETVPAELSMLDERPRRFEQSLATHLKRHGLLCAIRAAIAFAPEPNAPEVSRRRIRRYLTGFSAFSADPELLDLTMALIDVRHRPVEHLRGAAPLEALTSWIDYLRGRCTGFSESRGLSLREATNFAHYSLHLIDICELGASPDVELDDAVRRAIMDIEDELKEFALAGQREGLSDRDTDLHRYERTRWRADQPRHLLADRIARLTGAWRRGHRSGPTGSAPRPDDDIFDVCSDLVDPDEPAPELDAATHLIGHARLVGADFLEAWPPAQILSLLVVLLTEARRSESIDIDRPFSIDVNPVARWLDDAHADRRAELLQTLIQAHRNAPDSSLLTSEQGLVATGKDRRIEVDIEASAELEALLTLLAATSDDEAFAQTLRDRIDDLVQSQKRPPSPSCAETRPPGCAQKPSAPTSEDDDSSKSPAKRLGS